MNDDLRRLIQEISAARTRDEATQLFDDNAWIFLSMDPAERGQRYAEIDDLIAEKPTDD